MHRGVGQRVPDGLRVGQDDRIPLAFVLVALREGFVCVHAERRAGSRGIEPELSEERRGAALRLVHQSDEQIERLDGRGAPPSSPGLGPIKGAAGTGRVRFRHEAYPHR